MDVAHDRDTRVDLGELCKEQPVRQLVRRLFSEQARPAPSMAMMALVKLHSAPLYSASVSMPISCRRRGLQHPVFAGSRPDRAEGGGGGRTPCSKRPEMTAGSMISLSSISRTLGPTMSSAKRLTGRVGNG